jgi:uncharacterized protein
MTNEVPASWEPIMTARCIALTTYKKDGTPVTTPMWAGPKGGRILTSADFDAFKLKRIARNSRVEMAPCTIRGRVTGTFVPGVARVLNEAETVEALDVKKRKYFMFRIMVKFRKQQVGIVITPETTS